jgi:hypothetical protein
MDEATRTIIAYASLLLGLPLLAARILWYFPGAIVAIVLKPIVSGLDRCVDATVEGFVALFLACLLFDRLGLTVAWKIPAILTVASYFWGRTREGSLNALPSISGIFAGFILYPEAWLYLCTKFGVES